MKIAMHVSELCVNRPVGTTRYTRELADRLPIDGEEHEWTMMAPCEDDGSRWRASPWPKFWTQSRLPLELYQYRPDVLFMPIQQLPYLRPGNMKTVAVVHDLAFHLYPEMYTYKDWILQHAFTAYTVREANEIIAVSKATADDIAKYYGRTNGVTVVHHGVDHERFRLPSDRAERKVGWEKLVTAHKEVRQPYILYVGQIQPRKNLARLVKAFAEMREQADLQLMIASGFGWLQQPILKMIKQSFASERIHILGHVSDDLLPTLYRHAEAFVLPSLYEGFGMPILEGMAAGCPVVTSDVSSMPEVAGGAAVLTDPLSVESIKAGIKDALRRKGELREAGLKRAAMFNWSKTARDTRQVILES